MISCSEKNSDTVVNYYNVKRIYDDRYGEPNVPDLYNYQSLALSNHPNFEDSKVNLQHSAIHVPINVYEVSDASRFNLILMN